MADKQISELPAVSALTDDSLIPVYVPGSTDPAQSLKGAQFRAFAKEGVSAYVEAATEAANNALAAAQQAQEAVSSVQGAAEEAAAAQAANEAAQAAKEAAEVAREAAEAAAQTAADDATADVATNMQSYVQAAQSAQAAAETARDQAQAIAGGDFLPLAGGTLTGPLILAGAPTADLHPATKKYTDDAVKAKQDAITGTQGQIVGIGAGGKPVAQDAPAIPSKTSELTNDSGFAVKPKYVPVTLTASGWGDGLTQTVAVSGVLASETSQLIQPAPALTSQSAYIEAGILCTGQAANSLTFTAKTAPIADLTIYIVIQEVTA